MAATLSRLCRAWPMALLPLVGLAGCGDSAGPRAQFAPACPQPALVRDAADLTRYRGAGRDLTDLVLDGKITGLSGKCQRGEEGTVTATVSVGIDLTRGPAATDRRAELAYFIAVSQGERILDKRVFPLRAVFPENTDRLRLTGDDVDLVLPVPTGTTAGAYAIDTGFQLTPAELALNRARGRR